MESEDLPSVDCETCGVSDDIVAERNQLQRELKKAEETVGQLRRELESLKEINSNAMRDATLEVGQLRRELKEWKAKAEKLQRTYLLYEASDHLVDKEHTTIKTELDEAVAAAKRYIGQLVLAAPVQRYDGHKEWVDLLKRLDGGGGK